MNDEIKEILQELENMFEISELEEQVNNINKIKNYITNLQQENERLKERVANLERSNNRREDTIIGLRFEVAEQEDYKSRCEKAIEYIKQQNVYYGFCDDLLNILQNGSDSQ